MIVFDPSHWSIKSLLLGMKWVFIKYQDLQIFGLKLNKYE